MAAPGGTPEASPAGVSAYAIVPCENAAYCETFFPGRRATVLFSLRGAAFVEIGCFGVVHPEVLAKDKYDLDFPCSAVELNLEPFV